MAGKGGAPPGGQSASREPRERFRRSAAVKSQGVSKKKIRLRRESRINDERRMKNTEEEEKRHDLKDQINGV